jgi:hypothetical protein
MSAFSRFALSLLCFCSITYAAEIPRPGINVEGVQIVRMARTPEPDNVILKMPYPLKGQIETENPVYFSLKIEGYPLGTNSPMGRRDEIENYNVGQSIHIIVDDRPYFAVGRELINVFDQSENYYLYDIVVAFPFDLKPGAHLIRLFPARSFGESLKGDGCFIMRTFYFKEVKPGLNVDLSAPLLTYNEPQGAIPYEKGKPILLDFYVTNCELSKDGYKVKVTLDKTITRQLTEWTPYFIYNLMPGKHTVNLQLLDPEGKVVPGSYNNITREFTVAN